MGNVGREDRLVYEACEDSRPPVVGMRITVRKAAASHCNLESLFSSPVEGRKRRAPEGLARSRDAVISLLVPSPDATLGDGDAAARVLRNRCGLEQGWFFGDGHGFGGLGDGGCVFRLRGGEGTRAGRTSWPRKV